MSAVGSAADSGAFGNGIAYRCHFPKITRTPPTANCPYSGALVATTGPTADAERVRIWALSGAIPADFPSVKESGQFTTIILTTSGDVVLYGSTGTCEHSEAPLAIGSNSDYALALLHTGMTPELAVLRCCLRSIYARAPVQVMDIAEVDAGDVAP